jgi:DNA-binding MarR family transcriptional regulator
MDTKPRARKRDWTAPPRIRTFSSGGVPVRRTLIALAHRLSQICMAAGADVSAEYGLTPLQTGVLAYLNKVDGEPGIDQNGLAARLGVDRVSAGRLVNELEAMGFVERRINGDDRRARMLRLTPHGEKVRAQLHPATYAAYMRVLDTLDARQQELLLDLLVRVVVSNSALARPGAGRRKRGYRQSSLKKA